MPEVIFADTQRHVVIERSRALTPEFMEFLQSIVWGSGGVRYIMPKMADTLSRFQNPHFFSLRENGKLAAVTTINGKTMAIEGKTWPAFYLYGIAVDPAKRQRGYGALIAQHSLLYSVSRMGARGLFYGYIEASNISSIKTITKVGCKLIGQYHALVVSRLRPQDTDRCQQLDAAMKEQFIQLLKAQYHNHNFTDFDQPVPVDHCYVFRQGEEIVAGLRYDRQQLTIQRLPGVSGRIMVKVLPRIPGVRRLFPEGNLDFLAFGNLYAKEGREEAVFSLMEALLARRRLNFAMIYLDKRSPMYQRLAAVGRFGVFNALVDVPVQVMGYFQGFAETEVARIHDQPLFISLDDPV